MIRLEISGIELHSLAPKDYEWTRLSDFYIVRILKKANELGLQGKKIKSIVGIKENFENGNRYIDFEVEP